jgi:hypothetical protein
VRGVEASENLGAGAEVCLAGPVERSLDDVEDEILPKLNSQARTTSSTLGSTAKGPGGNAAKRYLGIQRGGGFCGCPTRGGLPRPARHRFGSVPGAADPARPARPATVGYRRAVAGIALVAVPADTILVSLPRGKGPAPIWGGIAIGAGEIMTLGAGQRLHMRTDGPCRWGSIWLPAAELAQYGSALTGAPFPVPSAARRWHLRPATMRHLRHLHSAAISLVERRSRAVIDAEAAHGLEQQLIHALVECFSSGSAIEAATATCKHRDVALRLEALLQTQPEQYLRTAEIYSAIDVSARALRISCEEQFGMGPTEYIRRRRMKLVPARERLV